MLTAIFLGLVGVANGGIGVGDIQALARCNTYEVMYGTCHGGDDGGLDIGDVRPGAPAPVPSVPRPPDPGRDAIGGHGNRVPPGGAGRPGERGGSGANPGAGSSESGGWRCVDSGGSLVGDVCIDPVAPEAPEESAPPVAAEPQVPVIPDVIDERDVASFAPRGTDPVIEPYGVAIMNAPMNVAFTVGAHTVAGSLFELPVNVTFVPDLVTIDYGDGTIIQVPGSAATWEGLGQQQLTPTATSHTYAERGTATVTVDVAYVATVDFGRWGVFPVGGHIVSRGDGTQVRIYEKQSYLVEHTCEENPSGPGC